MVLLRRNVRRQPRKKGWTKGQMAMAKAAVNTAGRMYRAFQGRKTQVSAVPSRIVTGKHFYAIIPSLSLG